MPPPGGMAGMGDSFFGFSATMASVVISSPAIEACVLQSGPDDLGRVDDALGHQVTVLALLGVVAVGISVILADLAEDDRSIPASIDGDLASRRAERFPDDVDASLLIVVLGSQSAKCLDGPQ
jgi:hypothetical protein